MADYRQQAQAQYDPSYNARVQALKNQLAQNTLSLDQSKTGINQNYDTQVGHQNLNNKISKNNISNTMLGRGLGASSIVTSGLAESDARNTRMVGEINTARTGALNDIEAQKAMLAQNMNNTLGQMAGDREKELMALANQLEDRDFEKNFKNRQLALQQQAQASEAAYRNAQLAMQREQMMASQREGADAISAKVDAITQSPELSPQQKYDMIKNLNTEYGNRAGYGDFSKKATALMNGYASGIDLTNGLKNSLKESWQSWGAMSRGFNPDISGAVKSSWKSGETNPFGYSDAYSYGRKY
ncbi:MAG: hypothetical protein ACRC2K_13285 [Clostridium sp.]